MRALGARFGNRLAATAVACGILWIAAALPVSAESPSPAPEATLSADETSTIARPRPQSEVVGVLEALMGPA
jgi:hypothetical protein